MQHHLRDNFTLQRLIEEFETPHVRDARYFEDKDLLQLVYYYEQERDLDKALEVIDHGLEQYKYNSEFYVAEARVYGHLKDYGASLRAVENGLNISPNDTELRIQRIYAQAALGTLCGDHTELDDMLQAAKGQDKVDALLCKAFIAETERNYHEMYEVLVHATTIDGRHPRVLERLWVAVELLKNYESSIEVHSSLVDNDPYNHLAWYNLGHAYAFVGDYDRSIMALEYAYLIEPTFEIAYKDCADLYYQVGHVQRALDVYLDAKEELTEIDLEMMVSMGQCYLDLDQPEEAKKHLVKAIRLDPFEEDARYLLGRSYFQMGVFDKARVQYAKAIQLDDCREEFYDDLAKCYHLMGDHDLANYYFKKATTLCPEDVSYWFHHLAFLLDIGSYKGATRVLDQALEHTYGTVLLYAKAAIALSQNKHRKGLSYLQESLQENANELQQFYLLYPEGKSDKQVQSLVRYMAG